MAKTSGNDLVVKALKDEGVDTVFYLTGGPMVDVAMRCIEIGFRSVDVRHEQAAAMAAHAYSRVSGKPGVCFAASGPGTTNLITGVGNAFLDAVPVVALGELPRSLEDIYLSIVAGEQVERGVWTAEPGVGNEGIGDREDSSSPQLEEVRR